MRARMLFIVAVSLALVIAAAPPLSAQGGRAEIRGTVVDQEKGVLPGVTITITEENTGTTRTAVTSADGTFVVPTLLPGTYTVKAELTGFQPTTRTGLALGVGQEVSVNLTLGVGGISEQITVTGEAPLVEVTASKVGSNITNAEIDSLPSQGRSQLSLMQLVPGLTPSLAPGTFEGGQFNANGRDTGSNLFLVDGVYNNDDRRGGSQGTQARVTLDTMAEFQVLTHQYTAEFGGSSGVVVNAVTKSGTNNLRGRAFYYLQDESLNSTAYFLKQEGRENPESGSDVWGGSLGGPIVRNKAFWFVNFERNVIKQAANLIFPPDAAPLAVSYSDSTDITANNLFLRTDYQMTPNQHLSFRWVREAAVTLGEGLEDEGSTLDNMEIENDSGDQVFSVSWTSVLGTLATNEFKVNHVRENLQQGNTQYFDGDWNFIGLNGRDQFDIGAANNHPDFAAGPTTTYNLDFIRTFGVDNAFTLIRNEWAGDHTFKVGAGYSRNAADPQSIGANLNGTYTFLTNRAFNPADPFSYPSRFAIRLGQIDFVQKDWRTNFYVQDKWQVNPRVTLNLGVRYDYQHITPQTKNAFAPRAGFAWDVTGTGKTLVRGGVGKFYEYQFLGTVATLLQQAVVSPSFLFDTGQDLSSRNGVIPAHPCLQPANNSGLGIISAGCRTFLAGLRTQVGAGSFVNTEPTVDGPRKLGYLYSFSLGLKQQLFRDLAVSVDYVGNRGRDQTGLVDINEPVNGRRPGVAGFDPNGELIPAAARGASFQRVLQFQTRDDFNTDYNALELSLEKRFANRWSGRASYTLARARDVGSTGGGTSTNSKRVSDDLNPRSDYGRTNFDNRHALAFSANAEIWKGLGGGVVFRYYSGYPINETIGIDANGDRDNFDRPVAGVNDATRPIQSELDAQGRAIRNGIEGERQVILDGRLQYLFRFQGHYEAGLFLELYNLTDEVNFGNPTGNRNSTNFLVPVTANTPRTAQLGLRLTF